MSTLPTHILEACHALFARLLDADSRNDIGGAYLGEELAQEETTRRTARRARN